MGLKLNVGMGITAALALSTVVSTVLYIGGDSSPFSAEEKKERTEDSQWVGCLRLDVSFFPPPCLLYEYCVVSFLLTFLAGASAQALLGLYVTQVTQPCDIISHMTLLTYFLMD